MCQQHGIRISSSVMCQHRGRLRWHAGALTSSGRPHGAALEGACAPGLPKQSSNMPKTPRISPKCAKIWSMFSRNFVPGQIEHMKVDVEAVSDVPRGGAVAENDARHPVRGLVGLPAKTRAAFRSGSGLLLLLLRRGAIVVGDWGAQVHAGLRARARVSRVGEDGVSDGEVHRRDDLAEPLLSGSRKTTQRGAAALAESP